MTEEEAQQTQCCGPDGCGYFNEQPHPARWCVGSGCMAWRAPKIMADERGRPLANHEQALASGYCGLAGEPK